MSDIQKIQILSQQARQAIVRKDVSTVVQSADAILKIDSNSDEGLFLKGKIAFFKGDIVEAEDKFRQAFQNNPSRHDVAVELATIYSRIRRNKDAAVMIDAALPHLQKSAKYLDQAGTVCIEIGMPEKAWPLYQRANELQPDTPVLQSNLANCAVYIGEFEIAESLFKQLIDKNPSHRQNHFHYSKLATAKNTEHIDQMKVELDNKSIPENRNTPLYFAIGKEYEDLESWDAAFKFYQKGNAAVSKIINYDPKSDIELIDFIIKNCSTSWMGENRGQPVMGTFSSPIFIVGLPRTGTTLVERILDSHSLVSSLGETLFVPRCAAKLATTNPENPANVYSEEGYSAFMKNCAALPEQYMDGLSYRLPSTPFFIDKLPLNYLFVGPLAKVWPNAKFVVLNRGAMDTCFSLYKQVFTWAYKFSYDLDHIGKYFLAYQKLISYWKDVLGERIIGVDYENLVGHTESETKMLLDQLGLPFEESCINFHENQSASTTASTVQVRSAINSSSIDRWREYSGQLDGLRALLSQNGVSV